MKILLKKTLSTCIGNRPLFKAFALNISAKKLEIMTLKPYPTRAHAACSLLEPQPKLSPATSILPLYFELFNTNSGIRLFSLSYRQSLNILSPKPFLSVAFKNLAGII